MFGEPKITILHVDDNEMNRYVVTRMLETAGFQVLEASTGEAGLQIAQAEKPDLAILDVRLPDMNGFEVCQQLKSNPTTALIPVLHLSASFVESRDKAQGLDSGADAYLAQPVEPIELIATVRALLRIRRAEESALTLAREWQTTFDSINNGVGLLDAEGRFLRCNQALAQLLCKSTSAIIGQPHQALIQTTLGCVEETPFSRVQQTQQRACQEIGCHNRWFSIVVDPVIGAQGTFAGAVYSLSDITDRRQAEESLRFLSEASKILAGSLDYKTTLTNVASLVVPAIADICFFDIITEGEIQRAAWQHYNPDKQAWFAKIQNYIPPQDDRNHPLTQALASGRTLFLPEVTDAWMQQVASSAEHLQFMRELEVGSLLVVPLTVGHQKLGAITCGRLAPLGYRYQLKDLLLLEELAHRAALALDNARLYREAQEANRMKDEFLATLSHELRSPLNAMLGWTRLLNTRKFDEETTARAMDTIERSARAQAQLVEDLLDVSRIIQGKLRLNVRPIPLTPAINGAVETVRPAAEAKEIDLQVILDPNAGSIAGDSDRLQQVVWNLLSNAIKFTPKGGQVQVELKRANAHVEISVSDTGKGISPEFVPHVFERFRQADSSITRAYSGLGLGLAIVRHLVELHGGTVHAYSSGEGQGATFTVRLPLMPMQVNVAHPEPILAKLEEGVPFDKPPLLRGVRVLVVDDEADAREYLLAVLEQCEAEAIAAASVTEALEIFTQYKPDILVSDIGMPGKDGYSLIRQVRSRSVEQGGRTPAVALTAYARAEDRTRAIAAGFQMHVPKPVEPAELATVIASLVKTML